MHREFSDDDFQKFLVSPEAIARTAEWEQTLSSMEKANMSAVGEGVLQWLPPEAVIRARVFPEIKPKTNSFVWSDAHGEHAIFLYLEKQTQAQFENTVSHECHHIGLSSLDEMQKKKFAGLPENVKTAIEWAGAFGEGEAMLAAAGSTERHPHWEDDDMARARWDSDMTHLNQDVSALTQFFNDILDGKLQSDAIQEKAAPFFGRQGAFYTVGYEMAALVEKRFGRQVFLDCLLDPRQLLIRYNEIAAQANKDGASLALWPEPMLRAMSPANAPD